MNDASKKSDKPSPWYTHRWPWLLMLGPAAAVVAGIHTTWLAYSHPDALVAGDYYKQGQAINQDLRRERAAAALGLSLRLQYLPAAGKLDGVISGNGTAGKNEMLRLRLVHSTLPEKDMEMAVQPGADGAFSVALPMLNQARWSIMLENMERDWRLVGDWRWPSEPEVTIAAME